MDVSIKSIFGTVFSFRNRSLSSDESKAQIHIKSPQLFIMRNQEMQFKSRNDIRITRIQMRYFRANNVSAADWMGFALCPVSSTRPNRYKQRIRILRPRGARLTVRGCSWFSRRSLDRQVDKIQICLSIFSYPYVFLSLYIQWVQLDSLTRTRSAPSEVVLQFLPL